MKNFLKEYKEFINKGDVVVVAVGLVMALYFKAIVDQLIAAVITPLIALIFGEASLDRDRVHDQRHVLPDRPRVRRRSSTSSPSR